MGISQWFASFRTARQISQLAEEVALRCRLAVQGRLGEQAVWMSRPEARGYVRARAAAVVRRELQCVLAGQRPVTASLRTEILGQATDLVVQRVTHDLFHPHVMATRRNKAG